MSGESKYPEQFRRNAVELTRSSDRSLRQVADDRHRRTGRTTGAIGAGGDPGRWRRGHRAGRRLLLAQGRGSAATGVESDVHDHYRRLSGAGGAPACRSCLGQPGDHRRAGRCGLAGLPGVAGTDGHLGVTASNSSSSATSGTVRWGRSARSTGSRCRRGRTDPTPSASSITWVRTPRHGRVAGVLHTGSTDTGERE